MVENVILCVCFNDIAPSTVEFMNHSRNSSAITVSWPTARSLLDGYIISISSGSLMKEEILPSTKRYENTENKLCQVTWATRLIFYIYFSNAVLVP